MRFHGIVGFVDTEKTAPGVQTQTKITERPYYGDVLRWNPREEVSNDQANDELTLSNQISILADHYANQHFIFIKYVIWMGVKWRVRDVNVNYPRLNLSLGGVYPEQEVDIDDSPSFD